MLVVAFIFFIALYIDIRMHVRKAKNVIKERQRRQQIYMAHLSEFDVSVVKLDASN